MEPGGAQPGGGDLEGVAHRGGRSSLVQISMENLRCVVCVFLEPERTLSIRVKGMRRAGKELREQIKWVDSQGADKWVWNKGLTTWRFLGPRNDGADMKQRC